MDLGLIGLPGVFQRSELVLRVQCGGGGGEDDRGDVGAEVDSRRHDDASSLFFGLKIYELSKRFAHISYSTLDDASHNSHRVLILA